MLSFDRELKRESGKFDTMVSKVEASYTTADASYRKAERIENKIEPLETQLIALNQSYQEMSQSVTENLAENTQNNTNLKNEVKSELSSLEAKLQDLIATQEAIKNRITGFEEQIQKLSSCTSTTGNQNRNGATGCTHQTGQSLSSPN